jgi:hypothetical protein
LTWASRTWEKDEEDEDGIDEFAEGNDLEELELDTFRHIIVQWVYFIVIFIAITILT